MPPLSEPWPVPVMTKAPDLHHDPERRARWVTDFNRGVDERNAERLGNLPRLAPIVTRLL